MFPDLIPARELVIQGVMVALLRNAAQQRKGSVRMTHCFTLLKCLLLQFRVLRLKLGVLFDLDGVVLCPVDNVFDTKVLSFPSIF